MAQPAKLLYSAITSLDGFTADADGEIEWAAPDPEVHELVNDLERDVGTYLYGRRMYETMRYWEDLDLTGASEVSRDFAELWRAANKVVYSRTLETVSSERTRLDRSFNADAVRRLKESASSDLTVGGADLAQQALSVGLVDEVHLFVTPIVVGGGTPALREPVGVAFELIGVDRFASGVVHLHYATHV